MAKRSIDIVKLYKQHGSLKKVWEAVGGSWHSVRKAYLEAVEAGRMDALPVGRKTKEAETKRLKGPEPVPVEGRVRAPVTSTLSLPRRGKVRRFILTSAQNDTHVHGDTLHNLLAYAGYLDKLPDSDGCRLGVARFTYMKSGLGASGDKARMVRRKYVGQGETLRYAPEVMPYILDERIELGKGLVWCGEMNILPTATNPLSDLEVYTGRRSCIIPHPKIAMQSVSAMSIGKPKLMYTTGTVTQRNYIVRKAGLKAEFHHCYGAILVEVDSDGRWWVRQLNADSEGTLYDLDRRIHNGRVTTGHRPAACYWSDLHVVEMNQAHFDTAFTEGGMLDMLRPRANYIGDVWSFRGRSHHDIKDPHTMFKRYLDGLEDVSEEVRRTGRALQQILRFKLPFLFPWANHDDHMLKWLRRENGMHDPINAELWLRMNAEVLADLRRRVTRNPVEIALATQGFVFKNATFLPDDAQSVVCPDAAGGIEMAMHGHLGLRGAHGNAKAFARMGRKACVGNAHAAMIVDGVYQVGTFSAGVKVEWAKGPSDWSCTQALVYPNGKRTLVTFYDGKWRA